MGRRHPAEFQAHRESSSIALLLLPTTTSYLSAMLAARNQAAQLAGRVVARRVAAPVVAAGTRRVLAPQSARSHVRAIQTVAQTDRVCDTGPICSIQILYALYDENRPLTLLVAPCADPET